MFDMYPLYWASSKEGIWNCQVFLDTKLNGFDSVHSIGYSLQHRTDFSQKTSLKNPFPWLRMDFSPKTFLKNPPLWLRRGFLPKIFFKKSFFGAPDGFASKKILQKSFSLPSPPICTSFLQQFHKRDVFYSPFVTQNNDENIKKARKPSSTRISDLLFS